MEWELGNDEGFASRAVCNKALGKVTTSLWYVSIPRDSMIGLSNLLVGHADAPKAHAWAVIREQVIDNGCPPNFDLCPLRLLLWGGAVEGGSEDSFT